MLSEPGVHDIPASEYHADPCPRPSLSRSVLKLLVDQSPAHARLAHPRLGARPEDPGEGSGDEVLDAGTAAHASFLQDRDLATELRFDSWRTKEAKAARAEAYARGLIPLLTPAFNNAMWMLDALQGFRARTGAFTKGRAERTVAWREGAEWCRARVDWLPDEPEAPLWDLKTTGGLAGLGVWSRAAFDKGADLQASFYARGVECVRGEPPGGMLFCVVEQRPPHGIGVFAMSPVALDIADQKVTAGISTWSHCLGADEWPGYPLETQWVDPPPWVVRDWQGRAALSERSLERIRARERPVAAQMVESGMFGG